MSDSVVVRRGFQTAHRLSHLGGACASIHRHSWQAAVTVSGLGDLDEISEIVMASGLAPVQVMPRRCDSATVLTRIRALADQVIVRG